MSGLLTHLVKLAGIHPAAGVLCHVHSHEGHSSTGAFVGGGRFHGVCLGLGHVGSGHIGVFEGCVLLQVLDHFFIFFGSLDAVHPEGNDLDPS